MSRGPKLSVDVAGTTWKNPISTASGTFGYGLEYRPFVDLSRLGAITVKGLSRHAIAGNPPPRIAETPAGMLNAIGLQNIGVDAFVSEKLPELRRFDTPVYVNIFGYRLDDYREVAEILEDAEGIAGLELNVSCPNVRKGGMVFGVSAQATEEVTALVKRATRRPLFVKLSPNVTDIVEIAKGAVGGGADGLTLINTLKGMAIDIRTRRPCLGAGTGGLSGPAIKPVALRMVYEVAKAVRIPIMGVGGIDSAQDVLEFLMAGACCVQIGTANFINPSVTTQIIEELGRLMARENIKSVKEVIGSALAEA